MRSRNWGMIKDVVDRPKSHLSATSPQDLRRLQGVEGKQESGGDKTSDPAGDRSHG